MNNGFYKIVIKPGVQWYDDLNEKFELTDDHFDFGITNAFIDASGAFWAYSLKKESWILIPYIIFKPAAEADFAIKKFNTDLELIIKD